MRTVRLIVCLALLGASAQAADTKLPVPAQNVDTTTGSTALGALNAACSVAMAGQAGAGFQLAAGTLIGTITPEVSLDGATTWVSTFFDDPATGNKASTIVFGSANTATTRTLVMAGGTTNVRVRVSAFTSGTANCFLKATSAADPSLLASAAPGTAVPPVVMAIAATDGANARVPEVASATNNTAATATGVQRFTQAANWSITHLPATATKATISKAAGGGTVRHVCTGFIASFCAVGTAQTLITWSIRDGATGAGTVLWSGAVVAPVNGCVALTQSGLNLTGSANTAMTIEFSAAGVTGSQETVSLQGYSTP